MKVIVFGATGMVGQGVLRECLRDPAVKSVLAIGRNPSGQQHDKLRDLVHDDFNDFSKIRPELAGYDACFFCLGVTSVGQTEDHYRKLTYDITLAAATPLAELNPQMTFVYVTGQGTDSTEKSQLMCARIKGKTENDLRKLPFKAAYMFRPGIIRPMHGIRSKTSWYQALYTAAAPLFAVLHRVAPDSVTTTEHIGRAMIHVARAGYPTPYLGNAEINRF